MVDFERMVALKRENVGRRNMSVPADEWTPKGTIRTYRYPIMTPRGLAIAEVDLTNTCVCGNMLTVSDRSVCRECARSR